MPDISTPSRVDALTIRPARLADVPALNAIRKQAYRVLARQKYTLDEVEGALAHQPTVDRQSIQDGTYFVAEVDGRVVAGGGWSFRATLIPGSEDPARLDAATDAARIRGFFVDPDFARRGIAQRLLHTCEREARAAGFRRLVLLATHTGKPLYARSGFQETHAVDVPVSDDATFTATMMTKTL